MLHFLKNEPQPAHFIEKPTYDPKVVFVSDLYSLINFPPYNLQFYVRKGINDTGPELYKLAASVVNTAISMLYPIPIIRKYYGDDFVHGVRAISTGSSVKFDNVDDTIQAEQFLRELTIIVEQVLCNALRVFHLYIYYHGDSFEFISQTQWAKLRNLFIDDRIIWKQ